MNRPRLSSYPPPGDDEIVASVSRLRELTHALSNLVGLTMNHLELCSMHMQNLTEPVQEHFNTAERLAAMATDQLRCLMGEVSYLHGVVSNGRSGGRNSGKRKPRQQIK